MLSSTSFWLLFISFTSLNDASPSSRHRREETPATNTPILLTEPMNITVREGETAVLPCDVKDLAPLLAIWLKVPAALFAGSYKLSTDSRISLSTDKTQTKNDLTIKGVVLNDTGLYACKVGSNPPLEVVHNLIVTGPPHIKTYPESGVLSLRKGETINLTCIATGNPAPTVVWKRRENLLPKGIKTEGETLIMKNATRKDTGIYECAASNVAHGEIIQVFRVEVYHEPEIEVPNSIVHTGINQMALLVCSIYANPSANNVWSRKNGHHIQASDKYIIYNNATISQLELHVDSKDDFGDYVCRANNSIGDASASIEVVGQPSATKITSEVIAYTENEYLLAWEVTSYSPITRYTIRYRRDEDNENQQWKKFDFQPAEGQEGPSYTERTLLTDLKLERYVIQVQAENEFGWNRPNEDFSFTLVGPSKTSVNSSSKPSSIFINIIVIFSILCSLLIL